MSRNLNRAARFETFEQRLVMSAQALSDFVADFQVDAPDINIDQQIEVVTQSTGHPELDSAGPLGEIGAQYDLTGAGQTIAVIDSGIAYDHAAFGDGFGAGHRVVGGYDFAENDANPYDDGPVGTHGTHVAGIIGGHSDEFSGIAPEADLVSLRVFDDNGLGNLEWVEQALQWVHENRHSFENPITTVNLSLGTDWNADTIPEAAQLEDEFAQLEADGIFISVAAGNLFSNYNAEGVSYPAASPFVIPVASHGADGQLSDFSQRSEDVLVAPGENLLSAIPDHVFHGREFDQYLMSSGTSQAAPYVAGASALLREAFIESGITNVNQDLLYDHFRETADVIHDAVTGGYFHRINLQRAFESLLGDQPQSDGGSNSDPAPGNSGQPVSLVGGLLTVRGTGGDDHVQFHQGQLLDVVINGQHHEFNANQVNEILVIGAGGNDSIATSFDGPIERAVLRSGRLDVQSPVAEFTARGFESISIDGGTNADRLIIRDSNGNDVVEADFDSISITGDGYENSATGFNRVAVRASEGFDTVRLTGSAGDDRFIANDGRNVLRHGDNRIAAIDFDSTVVYASPGDDIALLSDSAGSDQFRLMGSQFHVHSANGDIWGAGFERTIAESSSGFDSVIIEGSTGSDYLVHRIESTRLVNSNSEMIARGFDSVAVQGRGGQDLASILGGAGFDSFVAGNQQTQLHTAEQVFFSSGFESVDVWGGAGIDHAELVGSHGSDFVSANNGEVRLESADGSDVTVHGFENVSVDTLGGYDSTSLNGTTGNDLLRSIENGIELDSTMQLLRIVRAENHSFSGGGGIDEVIFSDFEGPDLLQALGDRATAWLGNQRIEATDFDFLESRARAGHTGLYEIDAVDFLYLLDGDWQPNQ